MSESLSDLMLRPERAKLVPLSEVTIWRLEKRGEFPRRIRIAQKRVAWSRREVEQWMADRMAQRESEVATVPMIVRA